MKLTRNEQRAVVAEFLGTMFFTLTSCGAVVAALAVVGGLDGAALIAIALGHGLGILIAVAWTAGISGGHVNPAVTVAMLICRKVEWPVALRYIVAQFAGAAAGAALLKVAIPNDFEGKLGVHALSAPVAPAEGLLLEIMMTALLVMVVFHTAVGRKGLGNTAPMAIGLAVLLIHLVAVPWTGASVNPARSFGPALVANEWADFWVYAAGPISGGALVGAFWLWWKDFGDPLDVPAEPQTQRV